MTGKLHQHPSAAFPSIVSPGKWPVRAEQPLYYRTESSLKRMSDTELWWLRFGELANTLSHERELLPQGKSAGSWHLTALVVWTGGKLSEENQDSGKRGSHHGSQAELTTVSSGVCSTLNKCDFWWCVIKCTNPGRSLSLSETMHHFQIILHQYKSHSSNVPE